MLLRLLGEVGFGADPSMLKPPPGRFVAGVLAVLAEEAPRAVSVSTIIDSGWDEPPRAARNAVQVAISKLRRSFDGSLIIRSTGDGYRLDTSLIRIDLHEAQQLLLQARTAAGAAEPAAAAAKALEGRALFAGEPFHGLTTQWARAARERAQQLLADLETVAAEALAELGRESEALELVRTVVTRRPLDEPAHALLMTLMRRSGRPAEALQCYEGLRVRLADELGIDPSAPVRTLFEDILRGSPDTPSPRTSTPAETVLASLSMRTRIPTPASPLIGRDDVVAEVVQQIGQGYRLTTLVGPGGIGKTRIAIAIARSWTSATQHPAMFADLTAAHDQDGIWQSIAAAVGVGAPRDARTALATAPCLLVLDNAEHLLDDVVTIVAALSGVETVSVVVTSRSPLRLRDERVIDVGGLPVDGPGSPAMRLLISSSDLPQGQNGDDAGALNAIVDRTGGIPLVLELVGAALRWTTPRDLLEDFIQVLFVRDDHTRDRPSRHRTVAATVEWSIAQASVEMRAGLLALTVMRGTFSAEAALHVLGTLGHRDPRQILAGLVDLSLVVRSREPGQIRLRLLEPIREVALASPLVPRQPQSAHRAHASYFLGLVSAADDSMETSENALVDLQEKDGSNIEAAVEWAWEHDVAVGVEHFGAVLYAWHWCGDGALVMEWAPRLVGVTVGSGAARARIHISYLTSLVYRKSLTAEQLGEAQRAIAPDLSGLTAEWSYRWAVAVAEGNARVDNLRAAVEALDTFDAPSSWYSLRIGSHRLVVLMLEGRLAEMDDLGRRLLGDPALADHPSLAVTILNSVGYTSILFNDFEQARRHLEEAIRIGGDHRTSWGQAGMVLNNLAWTSWGRGDHDRALAECAAGLRAAIADADAELQVEATTIAGLCLHAMGHALAPRAAMLAETIAAGQRSLLDSYLAAKLDRLVELTAPVGHVSDRSSALTSMLVALKEISTPAAARSARTPESSTLRAAGGAP